MDSSINDIDELIGKYLAGEATGEEVVLVEAWVNESKENKHYLDQFRTIFDRSASMKQWQTFDTDAAWNKVKSKLSKKGGKEIVRQPQPFDFKTLWKIAASIIVILGIGYFSYQWLNKPIQALAFKSNEVILQDTLPDGSLTVLNKQSTLAYEYNSKKKIRKLKLTGEAYFEVKHEEEKPFVIETQGVIIEDIGTTFNVKAYPESGTIEVFVETGEVKFYTLENEGLNLKEKETGIYDKVSKSFARLAEADTNILAYKTHVFNFNSTDLGSMVETLNEVYAIKIKLKNEKLKNCRLTVTFKGESIEAIAEIIAETLGLTMIKSGSEILLDGRNCGE